MNILLRNVHITDSQSSYHNKVQDVLIQNGIISRITDSIAFTEDLTIVEGNHLNVSQGWVDIFSHFNDPGMEQKETLESGAAAAAAGGYTTVFAVPNTKPAVQNKSQVEYIIQKSKSLPVHILPVGAATQNIEGKEIAEMYDMYRSGAVAFTDGLYPVQSAGLFLKVLQYVKAFDGVLIQQPFDNSIGTHGLVNEGIFSTQMGLPGIPAVGEEIFIQRDIELLRYAESNLHITGVSTARGIELITQAKAEGLQITCSVTPYHLSFCDEDLQDYDTNLKVNPPLRTKADRDALRQAVLDGKVDAIASHHFPQHWDDKVLEFEYAQNGMIGLQTAFAAVRTAIPALDATQIAALFSGNARKIFALPAHTLEEGAIAELTIFDDNGSTVLTKANNKSRSDNTPYFGRELSGKVVGTIAKGKYFPNN